MRRPLATLLLLSLACPSTPSPSTPPDPRHTSTPCPDTPARLAAAAADRADGYLFRALATTHAAAACAPRAAAHLEAQLLSDLGVDADATAAWRRFAAAPGATAADRAEADAAIADLSKRPPAERAATPDERATALLLYRDGINLRLQKDYPGALRQLRRAYSLWPHPLTIVQIGAIHHAAGTEVEARRANERALAIAEATRSTRAAPRVSSGNIGFLAYLAVSADGRRIVTIDGTSRLRVWDAATGRQGLVLDLSHGVLKPRNEILSADFDRDGALAVSLNSDGRVRAWSLDSGRLLREFPADDTVRAVAQLPDGRVVIGAQSIRIEAPGGGAPVVLPGSALRPPASDPDAIIELRVLAHDPAGKTLAALAGDGQLRVWRTDTDAIGPPTTLPMANASDIAVSPDGSTVAAVIGETLLTIDWRTGRTLHSVALGEWIADIAFAPTGLLAAAIGHGRIRVWDGDRPVADVATGARETSRFAWTGDAAQLVTTADDWSMKVFDVATGAEVRSIAGLTSSPLRMALAPDGYTLATSDIHGRVVLRDLRRGAVTRVIQAHQTPALGLAFSPDGRRLATGSIELSDREGQLALWDPATGTPVAGLAEEIELLMYSRDGERLYSGRTKLGGGGDQGVWTVGGDRIVALEAETDAIRSIEAIATSSASDLVAAGDNDEILLLPTRGPPADPVRLVHKTPGDVLVLAFSPDGRQLAAAFESGEVHLWDVVGRKLLKALPPAGPGPMSLAFAPDGRQLAVACFDGRIGIYELPGGAARTFAAHESLVLAVQFTPQGLLLSASMDGVTRLWDPRGDRLVATLVAGTDGRWLVIAADGRVDGSPGDEGGASLLSWQVGDVQFPGYVAWNRQHTPGLLRTLLSRATP